MADTSRLSVELVDCTHTQTFRIVSAQLQMKPDILMDPRLILKMFTSLMYRNIIVHGLEEHYDDISVDDEFPSNGVQH